MFWRKYTRRLALLSSSRKWATARTDLTSRPLRFQPVRDFRHAFRIIRRGGDHRTSIATGAFPLPRLVIWRDRDVRHLIRFLGAEVVGKFLTTKAVSKALFDLRKHGSVPVIPLPGEPLIDVFLAFF
jgi:hypothetical protein